MAAGCFWLFIAGQSYGDEQGEIRCYGFLCNASKINGEVGLAIGAKDIAKSAIDIANAPSRSDPEALTAAGTRARGEAYFGMAKAVVGVVPLGRYTPGLAGAAETLDAFEKPAIDYSAQANAGYWSIKAGGSGSREDLEKALKNMEEARFGGAQGEAGLAVDQNVSGALNLETLKQYARDTSAWLEKAYERTSARVAQVSNMLSGNQSPSSVDELSGDPNPELAQRIRQELDRMAVGHPALTKEERDTPYACKPGLPYWVGGCDFGQDNWQASWPDDNGPSYEQWLARQTARAAQRNQPQGNQGGGADCSPAARMRHAMSGDPSPMYWCP